MTKITLPIGSKFDPARAMELANLIVRAYQQFDYSQNKQSWEPEVSKKLIGSKTNDEDLDNPSKDGRCDYDILTIFKVIEFTFTSKIEVPFGFIAKRELEDGTPGIFVVFRGTLTTDEWYHNSRIKQVHFLEDKNLGEVSEGFNTVYTRSVDKDYIKNIAIKTKEIAENVIFNEDNLEHIIGEKSLEYAVREKILSQENCPDNAQIFVTGHSLGGALATLAIAHMMNRCFTERAILNWTLDKIQAEKE